MSKVVSAVHHLSLGQQEDRQVSSLLEKFNQLREIPGFLYYRLLKPIAPDDTYAIITFWQSRRHYRAAIQEVALLAV